MFGLQNRLPFLFVRVSIVLALTTGSVSAGTNLIYILDASNSMWGRIGPTAKIDTAKTVLQDLLAKLPAGVSPALMFYGHRSKSDCGDVELVAPFGSASTGQMSAMIQSVSPRGKTPIANALRAAGRAFDGKLEENNTIMLISDGIETCGGDPCAVAAELAKTGVNVQINVVGFDVRAKAKAQLQCIAKAGNGQYFDARNAGDFKVAVAAVQQQAAALVKVAKPAPPKPEKAESSLYFEDGFDGDTLSSDWELINPDVRNYLLEDGALTLVAQDNLPAQPDSGANILRLKKPLPKGNWTITARLIFSPQTLGEKVRLGLMRDDSNGLYATFFADTVNYDRTDINFGGEKVAQGKATRFTELAYYITGRSLKGRGDFFAANVAAIDLRLMKRGRAYTALIRLEPRQDAPTPPDGKWKEVQKLSALKPPGNQLVLMFGGQSSAYLPHDGEGVIRIDRIRVETP